GPMTLAWAARTGTPLVAMIAAHDRSINDALLRDPEAQQRFIQNARALTAKGYSGVHLNFEYVPAVHRDTFTRLVQELAAGLKSQGLHISIAVPAKTREDLSSDWVGAFDDEALGRVVDYVMVMTYDHHWRGGPPGPVGGIPW